MRTGDFSELLNPANVLNRARLDTASTNPNTGDFGLITSKTGNRTMQVGLQYIF